MFTFIRKVAVHRLKTIKCLNRVVIHNVSPGESPERLAEECKAIGLNVKSVGLEVDIVRRKSEGFGVASKDGTLFEPVEELLERFSDYGFAGTLMLDCIERRTAGPLLKAIYEGNLTFPFKRCVVSVNPMVLYFKAPKNQRMFSVEDYWSAENLVVLSHFSEMMDGYADSGAVLQWEPVPDDSDREARAEFLTRFDTILYKTPFCSITATFDPEDCVVADYEFFKSHGGLDRLELFGSLSHIRQVRKAWEKLEGSADQKSQKKKPGKKDQKSDR